MMLDKPQISQHICWVLCFISEEITNYPESPLNLSIKNVIDALFTNAIRTDLKDSDFSLIDVSFMAIMNLL